MAYDWHYQEVNADWLATRDATIRLDEPKMEQNLVSYVENLLSEDSTDYQHMQAAALRLKKIDGADSIAAVIMHHATKGTKT